MKLLAVCLFFAFEYCLAGTVQDKTRLLNALMQDYKSEIEPDETDLKFNVGFLCATYDETKGLLKTHVWERHHWKDSRLAWTPEEYGGVQLLRLDAESVWTPDTKLFNSACQEDKKDYTNVVVKSSGDVIWIPSALYKTRCTHGEDDVLTCRYKIGMWSIDKATIALHKWDDIETFTQYHNTTCPLVPTLKSSEVVDRIYPCCPEPYQTLEIEVDYAKKHD